MTDTAAPSNGARGGVSQLRGAIASAQTAPAAPAAPTPGPNGTAQATPVAPPVPGVVPATPAPAENTAPEGAAAGMSDEIAALERQIAEQTPQAPAAEGVAAEGDTIAGIPTATLIEQLKAAVSEDGQAVVLPDEIAERFMVKTRMDGQEVTLPIGEAMRGGIRQSTMTRKLQEVAAERDKLEERSARMRNLFAGWDEPTGAGLMQSLDALGKTSVVRNKLREKWGTPDQPNVDGFVADMQSTGHWATFVAAAHAYAAEYNQQIAALAPGYQQLPPDQRKAAKERAINMIRVLEQQQIQQLRRQAELAAQEERIRAAESKQQRDQLLAVQQQQQQQADPTAMQQLTETRDRAFAHFGLKAGNPVHEHYFKHWLGAEMELAKRSGQQVDPAELIARAAEATREQLMDDKQKANGTPAQPAAQGARPAAPAMPARPAAAPVASMHAGMPALPPGRTVTQFRERVKMLQQAGRKT